MCTCIVLDSDLHMLAFSIGRALSKLTRSSSYISEVLICYTDKTSHLKTFDPLLQREGCSKMSVQVNGEVAKKKRVIVVHSTVMFLFWWAALHFESRFSVNRDYVSVPQGKHAMRVLHTEPVISTAVEPITRAKAGRPQCNRKFIPDMDMRAGRGRLEAL